MQVGPSGAREARPPRYRLSHGHPCCDPAEAHPPPHRREVRRRGAETTRMGSGYGSALQPRPRLVAALINARPARRHLVASRCACLVALSALAELDRQGPYPARPLLVSARLCGAHCYRAVLVDLNHVPSEAATMEPPPEALVCFGDDRVGVGTSLDREALHDLVLQEGVERVPALSLRVDVSGHWQGDSHRDESTNDHRGRRLILARLSPGTRIATRRGGRTLAGRTSVSPTAGWSRSYPETLA